VTAVAVIVGYVIDGIHAGPVGDTPFLDSKDPLGITSMFTFIALGTLVITTLINAFGVRLLSILNNIGVATEILGMVVFALILLFFANNQSPSVLFDTAGSEAATGGSYLPAFALGMFMALFVVYGFDTAGTFGEETVDASRQAPRGVLWSVAISGIVGTVFLIAVILAIPDMSAAIKEGQALGFPIATTIQATLVYDIGGTGVTVGELYLLVILASVFVCTLAIQGAATRMMFSMSRDRHLPLGSIWGRVNGTFKTPANAAIAVGVLAAIPILVIGPAGGFSVSIAATGLIYLSYLLTNLGVLAARFRGWPHKPAWFNLGRWGKLVNIVAILYGGLMLLNIAIWQSDVFGAFGGEGRAVTNPTIDGFIKPFGGEIAGMPAWPIFEVLVITLIVVGAIYYAVAVRGTAADREADLATGEATIG
jgi:amino acid transporter